MRFDEGTDSMRAQVTTVSLTGFDADELRARLGRYGDFEYIQLTAGPFRGQLTRAHLGDSVLDMVTYSRDILVRGSYPQDRVTLGLILSAREAGYFNGVRFAVNEIIAIGEAVALDSYRLPAGSQLIGFQTSRNRLERAGITIPERYQVAFHTRLSSEILQLRHYIMALVTSQSTSNGCEPNDALAVDDELLAAFRRAIDVSNGQDSRVYHTSYWKRQRILKKFNDAVEDHLSVKLRIADLCKDVGVSQRMLEYICKDYYGISPQRYIMVRRLNAVRKQLLHAAYSDVPISAVASHFGFKHAGRFSQFYRSLFGELPTHTRAKRGSSRVPRGTGYPG